MEVEKGLYAMVHALFRLSKIWNCKRPRPGGSFVLAASSGSEGDTRYTRHTRLCCAPKHAPPAFADALFSVFCERDVICGRKAVEFKVVSLCRGLLCSRLHCMQTRILLHLQWYVWVHGMKYGYPLLGA